MLTIQPSASKLPNSMHLLFQVKRDRVITMASAPDSHGEDSLLRSISDGTASETGARFFRLLSKTLAMCWEPTVPG
jgi:hypothetical protein